jgi:hypothetical protein
MRVPPLFVLRKLILMALFLTSAVPARSQSTQDVGEQGTGHEEDASELPMTKASLASVRSEFLEPGADPENRLFLPFFKHMTDDQREFWGSAQQLRRPEALKTFLPFAGFTGLLIAEDSWISKQVPDKADELKRSQDLSNYGAFSLAGIAAGSYALGQFTGNDHLSETGFLSSEAALNSTVIAYALKEATQRQRPYDGSGNGHFFLHGSSFPSEHAALAWSVASIVAHEYPGPLTKFMAYSMASAVTITRVTGKPHFSSDAVVGSALGWYLGRQIFRARHDPELGGGAWGNLRDDAEERAQREARPPQSMGSPSVPLDSWVYPALERMAAFGLIETAFIGLKPWTRLECAQLTEEAGEALQRDEGSGSDLAGLQFRLQHEFAYEFGLLDGHLNATAAVESVYTRGVSASGSVLTDGYHFGQTFAYDFGRPFQRGTNGQAGGSFYAALGPAAIYVRAEFQHAPSAPPLSETVRDFIATADRVPVPPAEPFQTINRPRLVDAYVVLNAGGGWQLSFGQQSLSWAPGPGGSLLWSNNAEAVPMVRLLQSDMHLPSFLKFLGPARIDNFFGRLGGHTLVPHPYIYGNKINFKPMRNLELGFGRTVTIGGRGGTPLTSQNFLLSFFGRTSQQLNSVPGDSHASFDWTFYVPKARNYLVFYGDLYADDDPVPFVNQPKNPYRPGIYVTRFPRLPKLDLHLEAANSESPGQPANIGNLNYWNSQYRDGYTNNGNLIGNTVGRMGRTIQSWLTYWISPQSTLQFTYKHNSVSRDFVPQGGFWQDYDVRHEMYLASGLYVKSQVQFEHISHYPLLFPGPQNNLTAVVELGFLPHRAK